MCVSGCVCDCVKVWEVENHREWDERNGRFQKRQTSISQSNKYTKVERKCMWTPHHYFCSMVQNKQDYLIHLEWIKIHIATFQYSLNYIRHMYCIKIYHLHCNNFMPSSLRMVISQFHLFYYKWLTFFGGFVSVMIIICCTGAFHCLLFLIQKYPMIMLKTMAEIAVTRKRIATTIHTVCGPPDFEFW